MDTVGHLVARVHAMNDTASDPLSAFHGVKMTADGNYVLDIGTKRIKSAKDLRLPGLTGGASR